METISVLQYRSVFSIDNDWKSHCMGGSEILSLCSILRYESTGEFVGYANTQTLNWRICISHIELRTVTGQVTYALVSGTFSEKDYSLLIIRSLHVCIGSYRTMDLSRELHESGKNGTVVEQL
ncbi:hypothetical protein AVEN_92260-1 [Araneus ventricosus]|uniref:Uncharacterized protein n=1 Tax=Araneus ventricosus TaxID=182803 RepID=A0A4Y2AKW2_ARAVE|nr:hypothetical protein AVEN_92260-1 [Araneus ventricosus]